MNLKLNILATFIFLFSAFSLYAQHDHGPGNSTIKSGKCEVKLKGSRGYKVDRYTNFDRHISPGWRPYITETLDKQNDEVSLSKCYEMALYSAKLGVALNDHYYKAKRNDKIAVFSAVKFSFQNSDITFDGTIRAEEEKSFSSDISCKIGEKDSSVSGKECFDQFLKSSDLARGDVVSFLGRAERFKIKLK